MEAEHSLARPQVVDGGDISTSRIEGKLAIRLENTVPIARALGVLGLSELRLPFRARLRHSRRYRPAPPPFIPRASLALSFRAARRLRTFAGARTGPRDLADYPFLQEQIELLLIDPVAEEGACMVEAEALLSARVLRNF